MTKNLVSQYYLKYIVTILIFNVKTSINTNNGFMRNEKIGYLHGPV
jgi:hypothetical protein